MGTLHGYVFDETQWKTLGGNGQCVTAAKGGRNYFIKRLNKPKYPVSNNFSGDFKRQKAEECDSWLKMRRAIAEKLPGTGSGNIIKPVEYFREGSCFYEVTNLVQVTNIPYTDIWKETKIDKARMMMTIAMSLADIHKAGIVHGDLDPGNILISRSEAGYLITKLIDFTDAFLENDPPESIMSKDAWWSPEVAIYSKMHGRNPNPYRGYIGSKSDVFSLGLIFHQYCAEGGNFPNHEGVDYPWQVFMKARSLKVDGGIEPELRDLISSMLELNLEERPNMEEVHKALRQIVDGSYGSGPAKPAWRQEAEPEEERRKGKEAVPEGECRKGKGAEPEEGRRKGKETESEEGCRKGKETEPEEGCRKGKETEPEEGRWKGKETEPEEGRRKGKETEPEEERQMGKETEPEEERQMGKTTGTAEASPPVSAEAAGGVRIGEGRTRKGAFVSSARLHERNPKKVELVFSDGKKQIMDLALAVMQGFVK